VLGIDTNRRLLERANDLRLTNGIPDDQLDFVDSVPEDRIGSFDIVLSQNSMEHFPDPMRVVQVMKRLVTNSGKLLITFGPPWFAPYGSHMHFFCKVPWLNILFSERTVMKVRNHFRSDGATCYEDVEGGLNRMTIRKFEQLLEEAHLETTYKRYRCLKNLPLLGRLPGFRELLISHVTVIAVSQGNMPR
jgi:SAM-dependent methyltransferase